MSTVHDWLRCPCSGVCQSCATTPHPTRERRTQRHTAGNHNNIKENNTMNTTNSTGSANV